MSKRQPALTKRASSSRIKPRPPAAANPRREPAPTMRRPRPNFPPGEFSKRQTHKRLKSLARPERLELPTPRFVVWCSIQLSYGRAVRRGDLAEPPDRINPQSRDLREYATSPPYATNLSSSRRIDSPITPVPTLALPGPIMSAVRRPFFRTFTQAFSISSASSSIRKE